MKIQWFPLGLSLCILLWIRAFGGHGDFFLIDFLFLGAVGGRVWVHLGCMGQVFRSISFDLDAGRSSQRCAWRGCMHL